LFELSHKCFAENPARPDKATKASLGKGTKTTEQIVAQIVIPATALATLDLLILTMKVLKD
jgi:hypothetical protein